VKRLLAAVAAAACLGAACSSPRPSRVVVGIGLTPNSHGGAKLAAAEINAAGGVGGARLELAGLDWPGATGSFSPPQILETASRFRDTPGLVAVIGHSDSATTLSAAASYNRDRVPQIVTIATNPAITNIGRWTYRLCLSDAAQGPALAEYAVRDWQKRRIAIFYVNDDYGRGLARQFEQRARVLGAEIVASAIHRNNLQADDEDAIGAAIGELRAAGADLVALFQRMDSALWTVKAIRAAGLDVDILGGDNLAQYAFARAPGGLTEGIRVSQFLDLDRSDQHVTRFVDGIRATTGQEPDYAEAFVYDAIHLVRDAVLGGGYSRDGVKSHLDALIANRQPVRGIAGAYLLGADHDARRPLYVSAIEGGAFRMLKTLRVE
jgi:branched-chain amino acid transport system substrate-binding protein